MAEEKTQLLFQRLGISQERGQFLSDKCRDIYVNNMGNPNNKKDVVDILWELREYCTNASEDMFVCYALGAIQGFFLIKSRQHQNIMSIIDNIFKK